MSLNKEEVEALWVAGKSIPLNLAPGWLWRLEHPPQPIEDRFLLASEEDLGDSF